MRYLEAFTGFVIGLVLLSLLCWLFKARMKWYLRFLLSSALGAVILIAFNLFHILPLPVNPLNVFIIGFLGVFGVLLLTLVVLVL